ncbi:MAG: GNAT family N-acetyltransferase [Nitrospira sp.]|nr:GNAT family N-acetyltransferase [Nitrospira sp.]MCP9442473.1 GNAT family N-acetyltransferase [Nitrospira sp.]
MTHKREVNQWGYHTCFVRNRTALAQLAGEWDVLAEQIGIPTLSHAWTMACAEAFYAEDELAVLTVREEGELVAVAPLVEQRRFGCRRLELIGVSFLFEPAGFLYRDEEALACLVQDLVNSRLPVVLARVPVDSPIISHFQSRGCGLWRGAVIKGGINHSLMVPISSSWDEYLERLSPRRRYDLRRARRRAEERGTVAVRVFCPSEKELEQGFAEFVRIEASGWKDRHGSSLRQRDSLRRFFERYAQLASRSGTFRLAFLDVAGKSIAAQLSTVYGNRFWVFKIGYDEAWSHCSPGWQLLAETMRYAFEHRLTSYEFLGSDEPWLAGWLTEPRAYRTIWYYPATWRGCYGAAADLVGRVRGRIRRCKR